jgi:hypothetical protein
VSVAISPGATSPKPSLSAFDNTSVRRSAPLSSYTWNPSETPPISAVRGSQIASPTLVASHADGHRPSRESGLGELQRRSRTSVPPPIGCRSARFPVSRARSSGCCAGRRARRPPTRRRSRHRGGSLRTDSSDT